jgi:hypothetical protein
MREFVLSQQMFLDSGSKQFLDSLELLLMAYIEIISALFFILLLLAILLTLIERNEKPAEKNSFAHQQKHQETGSKDLRHSAYDVLFIKEDSLV